jgi:hypothetical protein
MKDTQDLLNCSCVALLGGADKIVVRDIQVFPEVLEFHYRIIRELMRRKLLLVRRFLYLLAVFIGAGEEPDIFLADSAAIESGKGIRGAGGIRMADMRRCVDII